MRSGVHLHICIARFVMIYRKLEYSYIGRIYKKDLEDCSILLSEEYDYLSTVRKDFD